MVFMGQHRKYFLRLLLVSGASCACFLLCATHLRGGSYDAVISLAFGGSIYAPGVFPPLLIMGSLPILMLGYSFSNYFDDDIERAAVYLFTRTKSRSLWAVSKLVVLLAFILAFYAANFLVISLAYALANPGDLAPRYWLHVLAMLVPYASLNSMMAFVVVTAINLLGLRVGPIRSFMVVCTAYLLLALACANLPEGVQSAAAHIVPTVQGFLSWHEVPAGLEADALELFELCSVDGFSLPYSYCYLGVCMALEIAFCSRAVNELDLI